MFEHLIVMMVIRMTTGPWKVKTVQIANRVNFVFPPVPFNQIWRALALVNTCGFFIQECAWFIGRSAYMVTFTRALDTSYTPFTNSIMRIISALFGRNIETGPE